MCFGRRSYHTNLVSFVVLSLFSLALFISHFVSCSLCLACFYLFQRIAGFSVNTPREWNSTTAAMVEFVESFQYYQHVSNQNCME